jgi:hypothetical protein
VKPLAVSRASGSSGRGRRRYREVRDRGVKVLGLDQLVFVVEHHQDKQNEVTII